MSSPTRFRSARPIVLLTAFLGLAGCEPTPFVDFVTYENSLQVGDSVRAVAVFGYIRHCFTCTPDYRYRSDERPEAFRWSTSDAAVATVDSMGWVHARAPGVFLLRAETDDARSDPAPWTVAAGPAPAR